MMDDRELALIAAFRLHEVAGRLNVLARVARSAALRDVLMRLSEALAERETDMSTLAADLPSGDRANAPVEASRPLLP